MLNEVSGQLVCWSLYSRATTPVPIKQTATSAQEPVQMVLQKRKSLVPAAIKMMNHAAHWHLLHWLLHHLSAYSSHYCPFYSSLLLCSYSTHTSGYKPVPSVFWQTVLLIPLQSSSWNQDLFCCEVKLHFSDTLHYYGYFPQHYCSIS
jgi:hypothetical protein